MKKLIIAFIIFLLILTPVLSLESNLHYMDSLTLKQSISNYVDITPTSSNYVVDYMEVFLYLFAQDDFMQTVTSQNVDKAYTINENTMLFRWEDVAQDRVSFDLEQVLDVNSDPIPITSKVSFPVKNIPLDIVKFTQHTDHIDSSPQINSLAIELAQGEDDLFVLENKIAQWVSANIEYNLSTITSEANIPSSIVLDQRYGVCDEITNLFISINRELGIPARFVSGIAYSESILFDDKWGNHGWAEVYFPEYGWVPYDVTYKQFGRTDATHIALQKSVDGNSPSVQYKTSGYNYDFSQSTLEMDTELIREGSKRPNDVSVDLSFFSDEVSFGSYNVVTARVTNLKNYYLSEKVSLSPTSNSEILSEPSKRISLEPKETKLVSWVVQVTPDLDSGYYYTFPMVVVDSLNYRSEKSFKVDQRSDFIEYGDVVSFMVEENTQSLRFSCRGDKEILLGETSIVNCDLSNIETKEFPVTFCLLDDCQVFNSKNEDVVFDVQTDTLGVDTFEISASGKKHSGSSYITIKTLDLARLSIEDVDFPKTVASYQDNVLNFKIVKTSVASPENVNISVTHPLFSESWVNDLVVGDQPFTLTMPGNLFTFGDNELIISYSFVDSSGEVVSDRKVVVSKLDDIKGSDYLIVGLNTLDKKVNNILNKEQDKNTTIISVIIFAIVLSLVLTLFERIIRIILRRK